MLSLINILLLLRYFTSSPIWPPPSSIRPIYLRCGGPSFYTTAVDRLGDREGWLVTLVPHAQPCSRCVQCRVFCLRHCGLYSCVTVHQCNNFCIWHHLLTGLPISDFHVCPADETTLSFLSKISDTRCCHSTTSACGIPYHILPWSGLWSGFNPL